MRDRRRRGAALPCGESYPRTFPSRPALIAAMLLALSAAACDRAANVTGGGAPPSVSAGALKGAASDPGVKAFYAARQWKPAWNGASERALMKALENAPAHGLSGAKFLKMVDVADGGAEREATLTLAALTYARALSRGAVDPKKVEEIFALDMPKDEVAAGLAQALQSGEADTWIESLAPKDSEYSALSAAYVAARRQADEAASAPLQAGPPLRVGMTDSRVGPIVQRLIAARYLAAAPEAGAEGLYSQAVADAVKALQKDEGKPATGVADAATVTLIDQAPAALARQLAVNMERRRWLSRQVPATRIDVNTAAAEFAYLKNGAVAWSGRAVVGDPDHQTPSLGGGFKQVVANPPWNVPEGIAAEEILPKGGAYMARNNFTMENGRVVQRPGPGSALGLVKFDMQNRYAIYLHDTPAKALFQTDSRHRSHGCVRLDRAVDFARFLAGERGKGPAFEEALASGETTTVALGEEIPVRLLYHTAYLGPDGQLVVTADPYGRDDDLAEALGLTRGSRRGPAQMEHLLGP